jgi:hypothetical protein
MNIIWTRNRDAAVKHEVYIDGFYLFVALLFYLCIYIYWEFIQWSFE